MPMALVHGDLIEPNVIRRNDGKIFLIDFSVTNFYPRIYELTWLFSNMFFDPKDPTFFEKNFCIDIPEYQKFIKLTDKELKALLYLIKVAHAMHIIGASHDAVINNNTSKENQYWLESGRAGLQLALT